MKKEYNSPEAEIDFFNILSSKSVITTSGFSWEEDGNPNNPFEIDDSEENPWG